MEEVEGFKKLAEIPGTIQSCEYDVGPFYVTVFSDKQQTQGQYQVRFRKDIVDLWEFKNWANKIKRRLVHDGETKILELKRILEKIEPIVHQVIQASGKHLQLSIEVMKPALALEVLGLGKLAPLLLDHNIEEIYLDGDSEIYLDHSVVGRCSTTLRLSQPELKVFLSRVVLENDSLLTETNPSMKADLITEWFHLRVSADIPPLTIDGSKVIIRKLRESGLTLPDLCKNGTITLEAAAFLLFGLLNGVDITIVGSPASGKTTLQNAVLAFLPPFFRVVSIEDVEETFAGSFKDYGHLIRFRVDPVERGFIRRTKSEEVIKLLHRSPDVLCFAEISTLEHAKAWFDAMCAGIQSIQTIHGETITTVLVRLNDIFSIPPVLIKSSAPHIFVEVRGLWRGYKRVRRVTRIAEILNEMETEEVLRDEIQTRDIYHFDALTDKLTRKGSLVDTITFSRANEIRPLSKKKFYFWIDEVASFLQRTKEKRSNNVSRSFEHLRYQIMNYNTCSQELTKDKKKSHSKSSSCLMGQC